MNTLFYNPLHQVCESSFVILLIGAFFPWCVFFWISSFLSWLHIFLWFLGCSNTLLLLSFTALHGHQSCNYHIFVDFVVTVVVCRLGKLQWWCANFHSVLLFSCTGCNNFLTAAICFKSYDWCQSISPFFSWDKIFQTTCWQQSLPTAMTQFLWSGEDHLCC
jgi:hypothetical protein